ncbi:MAG: hypothetical protein LKI94_09065 [Sporolactobacillus sp.]|jgi:hypothetical protein|nr:hypothetical protein [Sporolactobacillus sp.]
MKRNEFFWYLLLAVSLLLLLLSVMLGDDALSLLALTMAMFVRIGGKKVWSGDDEEMRRKKITAWKTGKNSRF